MKEVQNFNDREDAELRILENMSIRNARNQIPYSAEKASFRKEVSVAELELMKSQQDQLE